MDYTHAVWYTHRHTHVAFSCTQNTFFQMIHVVSVRAWYLIRGCCRWRKKRVAAAA